MLRKLSEEGTLAEIKKNLGWIVNSRLLETELFITKGNKWIAIILDMIDHRKSSAKELEKLIGRLIRVLIIISGSSSFLKPLRIAFYSVKNRRAFLNDTCVEDLKLWISIIKKSIEGVPISKLILHLPNRFHFTDALE